MKKILTIFIVVFLASFVDAVDTGTLNAVTGDLTLSADSRIINVSGDLNVIGDMNATNEVCDGTGLCVSTVHIESFSDSAWIDDSTKITANASINSGNVVVPGTLVVTGDLTVNGGDFFSSATMNMKFSGDNTNFVQFSSNGSDITFGTTDVSGLLINPASDILRLDIDTIQNTKGYEWYYYGVQGYEVAPLINMTIRNEEANTAYTGIAMHTASGAIGGFYVNNATVSSHPSDTVFYALTDDLILDSADNVEIAVVGGIIAFADDDEDTNIYVSSGAADFNASITLREGTTSKWTMMNEGADADKYKIKNSNGVTMYQAEQDGTTTIGNASERVTVTFDDPYHTISTTAGDLHLNSAAGNVTVDANLTVGYGTDEGRIYIGSSGGYMFGNETGIYIIVP